MIQNTILPDDPRLTAYALDEMEPAERMEFEKLLQQDATARQTVVEIRATVASVAKALADEPIPMSSAKVEHAAANGAMALVRDFRRLDSGQLAREGTSGRKIKFPHFYYVVSGLAAACFAVFFVYWQRTAPLHEKKNYIEVPLAPANVAQEADGTTVELPAAKEDAGRSYANVRRFLQQGRRPPVDAVKIEEMVDYFPYDYAGPERAGTAGEVSVPPFAAHLEIASAPWAPEHRLVRIGLKAREVPGATRLAGKDALLAIAKDVKLECQFNPAVVQAYRLIGYENRLPAEAGKDFNNDKIDAGEIGAGRTMTALYEVVPVGVAMPAASVGAALDYRMTSPDRPSTKMENLALAQMLTLKIHYKNPTGEVGNELEFPLYDHGTRFADATEDFKFATSVAAFGMILRDSPYKGSATLADIAAWGRAGIGRDAGGYRHEFLGMIERSKGLLQ